MIEEAPSASSLWQGDGANALTQVREHSTSRRKADANGRCSSAGNMAAVKRTPCLQGEFTTVFFVPKRYKVSLGGTG